VMASVSVPAAVIADVPAAVIADVPLYRLQTEALLAHIQCQQGLRQDERCEDHGLQFVFHAYLLIFQAENVLSRPGLQTIKLQTIKHSSL